MVVYRLNSMSEKKSKSWNYIKLKQYYIVLENIIYLLDLIGFEQVFSECKSLNVGGTLSWANCNWFTACSDVVLLFLLEMLIFFMSGWGFLIVEIRTVAYKWFHVILNLPSYKCLFSKLYKVFFQKLFWIIFSKKRGCIVHT